MYNVNEVLLDLSGGLRPPHPPRDLKGVRGTPPPEMYHVCSSVCYSFGTERKREREKTQGASPPHPVAFYVYVVCLWCACGVLVVCLWCACCSHVGGVRVVRMWVVCLLFDRWVSVFYAGGSAPRTPQQTQQGAPPPAPHNILQGDTRGDTRGDTQKTHSHEKNYTLLVILHINLTVHYYTTITPHTHLLMTRVIYYTYT